MKGPYKTDGGCSVFNEIGFEVTIHKDPITAKAHCRLYNAIFEYGYAEGVRAGQAASAKLTSDLQAAVESAEGKK